MKITLIQMPHFYGKGLSSPPNTYPLGLGYIASVLEANNISYNAVDLWDMQATVSSAVRTIGKADCDAFGISAYSTQYSYLKEFSLRLKQLYPDIPIICGGAGATFSSELILKHTGVDVCVIGEGEETIIDLLNNLDNPENVKGIAYKKADKITKTDSRNHIKDLSDLPFTNRNIFNHETYINNMKENIIKGRRGTNIVSARGCPYSCNFCSKTFAGYRSRSVDDVINEIYQLKKEFNLDALYFNDELFTINKKRILAFCNELKRLDIVWGCQGRIDVVDEEMLRTMKEAGCVYIGYGVEAVSQSILNNMNKRLDANKAVSVIKLTKKTGIKPLIQYMYGYIGENHKTIKETEAFFKEIDHSYYGSITTPIPGTVLYDQCVEKGLIKDEEDYIMRLDSGYNLDGTAINLTEFSDDEFLSKRIELMKRVNSHYYKRHPIKRVKRYAMRLKTIFENPRYYLNKLIKRFGFPLFNQTLKGQL